LLTSTLRRLGYRRDEMTIHGFRTTAASLLSELGYRADAIERQLAHAIPGRTRRIYNRAEYLRERTAMMQAWANYLDGCKFAASRDCRPSRGAEQK
jgi:integrase